MVNTLNNHAVRMRFPLVHYEGVTVMIDMCKFSNACPGIFPGIPVNIRNLCTKLCPDGECFVMRARDAVEHMFLDLYNIPLSIQQPFFRLKILELLLYLSAIDVSGYNEKREYFPKQLAETVKQIKAQITDEPEKRHFVPWHCGTASYRHRDVREYTLDSLLRNISVVFQKVYLFDDTITNNIRFGKPGATMDEIIAAAKKACCHDFISSLPQGYDTMVSEGGAALSGGERQRISIARAMLKDAPIIILDEATSNVDLENESLLQAAIEALTKDKTIIMIAHRLKTVRHANRA